MYLSHNIVNRIVELECLTRKLAENIDNGERNKIIENLDSQIIFFLANDIGIKIDLKEAQGLATTKKIVTKDFRGDLLENLKSTLQLSKSIAENKNIDINIGALLQINTSIAQKISEDWQLNYRVVGENYSKIYDNLTDIIDESGFNAGESYGNIVHIILETYNNNPEVNRFYAISELIMRIIKIHPFIVYNKYSTLFIAHTLFARVLGIENQLINLAEFFTQKHKEITTVFANQDAEQQVLTWHELFLSFCEKQIKENVNKLGTRQGTGIKSSAKPFLDLNKRQLKILKYLQTIPTVKREDYVQMMEVSTMTAYRDLQILLKHKLIKAMGTGRGTKYTLANR